MSYVPAGSRLGWWDLHFLCLAVPPCQETGCLQGKCTWAGTIESGTLWSHQWIFYEHEEVMWSLHGVYDSLVHARPCSLFADCATTPGPLQLSDALLSCLCNACVCNTVPMCGSLRCAV